VLDRKAKISAAIALIIARTRRIPADGTNNSITSNAKANARNENAINKGSTSKTTLWVI